MKILLVNKHCSETTGGSELQCDLIASELAKRGNDVHYLAPRLDQDPGGSNYRIHPLPGETAESITNAIRAVDPDVVYWRYNRNQLAPVASALRKAGIPICLAVSNRTDLSPLRTDLIRWTMNFREAYELLRTQISHLRSYRALDLLDGFIHQCADTMGHRTDQREVHIPNVFVHRAEPFDWPRPYIAWVANLKSRKQPEAVIRTARRLQREPAFRESGVDILMAGEIQESAYEWIRDSATLPENVHYIGRISQKKAQGLIAGSMFLIHTCRPEGFPNTFIQAWSHGRPVVSLAYDPDRTIERWKAGYHSGSEERFIHDILRLLQDEVEREAMGKRGKTQSGKTFDLERNVARLEEWLLQWHNATAGAQRDNSITTSTEAIDRPDNTAVNTSTIKESTHPSTPRQ